MSIKAFKGFDKDFKCRGFQYEVGETYRHDGDIAICDSGFHFCKDLVLCFEFYPFSETNRFCEVEVISTPIWDEVGHKGVASDIKILREIPRDEILSLIDDSKKQNSGYGNSGSGNSGSGNSGDWNSGDRNSGYGNSGSGNSGNRNSGYGNSGYGNSGSGNSGNRNSGDRNSGYGNSGSGNSGNRNSGYGNSGYGNSGYGNSGSGNSGSGNSGDWNSGDWNACNHETGAFNTEQPETIRVFNKPCDRREWENAEKPGLLYFDIAEDQTYKEAFQASWDAADESERAKVLALPNFDAGVFFEISGIRVDSLKEGEPA